MEAVIPDLRPTTTLSKSSTTNMCIRAAQQPPASSWRAARQDGYAGMYMFLTGSDSCATQKGAGLEGRKSFFFRIRSSAIRAFGGCLGSKRR